MPAVFVKLQCASKNLLGGGHMSHIHWSKSIAIVSTATQEPSTLEPVGAQGERCNEVSRQLGSAYPFNKLKPHNVTSVLNYFKDEDISSPSALSCASKPQKTVVHDIRGIESQYALDTEGFQIVNHESKEKEFLDNEQIKQIYYPETEELLEKVTGASKVFIFGHGIRRAAVGSSIAPTNPRMPVTIRGPLQRVHVDQSYAAGPKRVCHHLPDEAPTLLKGRYQIINVWRPIKTILKDPLGVAEASSIQELDLVPIKHIYPDKKEAGRASSEHKLDKEGETFFVRASPGHKWYFLYGQKPEEVLLIKCFDSKKDGRARRALHTAFVNEEHEDKPNRESIEVRALVFHPNDTE